MLQKRKIEKTEHEYQLPKVLSFCYDVNYNYDDTIVAEQSFTLLDWIICEKLTNEKAFNFKDADKK
jgi:hypothetical protein